MSTKKPRKISDSVVESSYLCRGIFSFSGALAMKTTTFSRARRLINVATPAVGSLAHKRHSAKNRQHSEIPIGNKEKPVPNTKFLAFAEDHQDYIDQTKEKTLNSDANQTQLPKLPISTPHKLNVSNQFDKYFRTSNKERYIQSKRARYLNEIRAETFTPANLSNNSGSNNLKYARQLPNNSASVTSGKPNILQARIYAGLNRHNKNTRRFAKSQGKKVMAFSVRKRFEGSRGTENRLEFKDNRLFDSGGDSNSDELEIDNLDFEDSQTGTPKNQEYHDLEKFKDETMPYRMRLKRNSDNSMSQNDTLNPADPFEDILPIKQKNFTRGVPKLKVISKHRRLSNDEKKDENLVQNNDSNTIKSNPKIDNSSQTYRNGVEYYHQYQQKPEEILGPQGYFKSQDNLRPDNPQLQSNGSMVNQDLNSLEILNSSKKIPITNPSELNSRQKLLKTKEETDNYKASLSKRENHPKVRESSPIMPKISSQVKFQMPKSDREILKIERNEKNYARLLRDKSPELRLEIISPEPMKRDVIRPEDLLNNLSDRSSSEIFSYRENHFSEFINDIKPRKIKSCMARLLQKHDKIEYQPVKNEERKNTNVNESLTALDQSSLLILPGNQQENHIRNNLISQISSEEKLNKIPSLHNQSTLNSNKQEFLKKKQQITRSTFYRKTAISNLKAILNKEASGTLTVLGIVSSILFLISTLLYLGLGLLSAFDHKGKEAYFDHDPSERTLQNAAFYRQQRKSAKIRTDDWGYFERTYFQDDGRYTEYNVLLYIVLTCSISGTLWLFSALLEVYKFIFTRWILTYWTLILDIVGLAVFIPGNAFILPKICIFFKFF